MIRHQIGFLALILSISACSKDSGRSVSADDAMRPIGDTAIVSTDSEVTEAGMPSTADGGPQPTADAGPDSPVVGFIADTLTYRPIGYETIARCLSTFGIEGLGKQIHRPSISF